MLAKITRIYRWYETAVQRLLDRFDRVDPAIGATAAVSLLVLLFAGWQAASAVRALRSGKSLTDDVFVTSKNGGNFTPVWQPLLISSLLIVAVLGYDAYFVLSIRKDARRPRRARRRP